MAYDISVTPIVGGATLFPKPPTYSPGDGYTINHGIALSDNYLLFMVGRANDPSLVLAHRTESALEHVQSWHDLPGSGWMLQRLDDTRALILWPQTSPNYYQWNDLWGCLVKVQSGVGTVGSATLISESIDDGATARGWVPNQRAVWLEDDTHARFVVGHSSTNVGYEKHNYVFRVQLQDVAITPMGFSHLVESNGSLADDAAAPLNGILLSPYSGGSFALGDGRFVVRGAGAANPSSYTQGDHVEALHLFDTNGVRVASSDELVHYEYGQESGSGFERVRSDGTSALVVDLHRNDYTFQHTLTSRVATFSNNQVTLGEPAFVQALESSSPYLPYNGDELHRVLDVYGVLWGYTTGLDPYFYALLDEDGVVLNQISVDGLRDQVQVVMDQGGRGLVWAEEWDGAADNGYGAWVQYMWLLDVTGPPTITPAISGGLKDTRRRFWGT